MILIRHRIPDFRATLSFHFARSNLQSAQFKRRKLHSETVIMTPLATFLLYLLASQAPNTVDEPAAQMLVAMHASFAAQLDNYATMSFDYQWDSPTPSVNHRGHLERGARTRFTSQHWASFDVAKPPLGNRDYLFDGKRWRVHVLDRTSGTPVTAQIFGSEPQIFPEGHPFQGFGIFVRAFDQRSLHEVLRTSERQRVIRHPARGINVVACTTAGTTFELVFEDKPPFRFMGFQVESGLEKRGMRWRVTHVLAFGTSNGASYPAQAELGDFIVKIGPTPLASKGEFVIQENRGVFTISNFELRATKDVNALVARERDCPTIDVVTGETRRPKQSSSKSVTIARDAVKDAQSELDRLRQQASQKVNAKPVATSWIWGASIAVVGLILVLIGLLFRRSTV